MSTVNKVILLGNLGKDPEIRHLENNRTLAKFPLATNDTYKTKAGERINSTAWHNVVMWTPLAEIAEKHLVKGKQVYIEGKLSSRSYTDREGQTKHATEVVAHHIVLLGSGKGSASEAKEASPAPAPTHAAIEDSADDGLPF